MVVDDQKSAFSIFCKGNALNYPYVKKK